MDSSEDNSDEEVAHYIKGLSEKDRTLLLNKLQGKDDKSRRHSHHKQKHRHHSRKSSSVSNKHNICYCNTRGRLVSTSHKSLLVNILLASTTKSLHINNTTHSY